MRNKPVFDSIVVAVRKNINNMNEISAIDDPFISGTFFLPIFLILKRWSISSSCFYFLKNLIITGESIANTVPPNNIYVAYNNVSVIRISNLVIIPVKPNILGISGEDMI